MKNTKHNDLSEHIDALAESTLILDSFEEASDALIELKELDKSRARDVALKILNQKIGDTFYQAFAFEILYATSVNDAIAYIENKSHEESTYVLGAMLTAVAEDVGTYDQRNAVSKAISLLRQELTLRTAEELQEISEEVTWFVDSVRDF